MQRERRGPKRHYILLAALLGVAVAMWATAAAPDHGVREVARDVAEDAAREAARKVARDAAGETAREMARTAAQNATNPPGPAHVTTLDEAARASAPLAR